ncbi:hypothetical protein ACVIRO_001015 [Rhizobium ruizarguesonis]
MLSDTGKITTMRNTSQHRFTMKNKQNTKNQ